MSVTKIESAEVRELAEFRHKFRHAKYQDESEAVANVLSQIDLTRQARDAIVSTAGRIVKISRSKTREQGTIDAFLQEFGLSNQEGVALMCLAEALLRIPDADTQDALIAEKIRSGDWSSHRHGSESTFVNASVWALMLTGRLVKVAPEARRDPGEWMRGMVQRLGEPVIRQAVNQAMRIMGRQFVFGRSIKDALARKDRLPVEQQVFSFDMLGEGARTEDAARRYFELYHSAIEAIGTDNARGTTAGRRLHDRSSVSIKLSALHPRYEQVKRERIMAEMLPRLRDLALASKSAGMQMTIDSEEADRLDLTLDLFEALARDPKLRGWDGLGLAVQAYQKRCIFLVEWLACLARDTGRKFPVRLVKGAYWDTEIKHAQELGVPDYTVFTRKAATDVSYLACAGKILAANDALVPQFATHNAHTIAAIHHMADGKRVEFQRLHGMGRLLYSAAVDVLGDDIRLRTYAPVGAHRDLLPYLVRRLLENGANSSFVNRFMNARVPVEEIVGDPITKVEADPRARHSGIPVPPKLFGDMRRNSEGLDLSDPVVTDELVTALKACAQRKLSGACLVNGSPEGGEERMVTSPIDRRLTVGTIREASADICEAALASACQAQPAWKSQPPSAHAQVLRKMAEALESHRQELIDLCIREAGKTIADGVAEIREAVDFCRYYANRAEDDFAPAPLPGPTGESNTLLLEGRGVFLCISPWNFPLAIFTGQIAAALAAGNAVIAKPAEQTSLLAFRAVQLYHDAGVPNEVLHLLCGTGPEVAAPLLTDQRIAGVAFTGSVETAQSINRALAGRNGPIVPLIAETGGQNAMIVDSTALAEQVTDDVMISAFSSAGQRCSALRVLCLQDTVADSMIRMLQGALAERAIGDPGDLATDIGPVIDEQARARLQAHVDRMTCHEDVELLAKSRIPKGADHGVFFAPHIFEIPDLSVLEGEVFGPILHILRYRADALDTLLEQIRATGFGLTFGIHSRLETRWDRSFAGSIAGNVYVNRNMIGAIVGSQPFGGRGLSGTGPKAGGPRYLHRFASERVLTINTAAIGGNTDLFRLEEGDES